MSFPSRDNVAQTESIFSTDHLKVDLKGRSVRGGMVTLLAQVCKFVLSMGSTMVLARLLTPKDYGLIGMVSVVTGFVALFMDLGLSMATVQRAEINHDQVSNLFLVNVGISFFIMLLVVALAPAVAAFYGEPHLAGVTIALAVAFLFGGLTVQHQALLRRQMKFFSLAIVDIGSLVTSIVVGISLAWYGAKYWSLV